MRAAYKHVLLALCLCTPAMINASPNEATASSPGFQQRYHHYRQEQGHNPFGVYWREAPPEDYIFLAPAHFGATLFMAVGNVVGWLPKIVYRVCSGDVSMEAFLPPVEFSNRYFGITGAYLLGSPFWCLKKAFWDFPVWVFSDSATN